MCIKAISTPTWAKIILSGNINAVTDKLQAIKKGCNSVKSASLATVLHSITEKKQ
jgi:hypothetical protein